ncbi:hypothetical protein SAMN05443507_1303 [Alicyclobacillus tolerans]|uniref:DUF4190 domain-containing protein n=2 Tax=Alicyclobacillus tolerans TaxID=90970 RepID=A0A1M6WVA2_9BACL|nr:hypothetical protein SAMN05443507_1303 [Alicyclobacillus montanus]
MTTMREIDMYVDSIYSDLEDSPEVAELKEEMRNHLIEASKTLQQQGYSEKDSIRVAIERFGDEDSLRKGLNNLYHPPGDDSESPAPARNNGIVALILSALSIVVPLLGLIFGVIGFLISRRNAKNRKATPGSVRMSSIALVISIVGIVIQLLEIIGTISFYSN